MFYKYYEYSVIFIVRRPFMAFILGLLLIALTIPGLGRLKMETDYTIFFNKNDPMVVNFNKFQSQYGREDSVYLMVDTKKENGVFEDKSLVLINHMVEKIHTWPFISRINALSDYPLVRVVDNDLTIGPGFHIENDAVIYEQNKKEIIDKFLTEDAALGRLISKNGQKAGIWVVLNLDQQRREDSSEQIYRSAAVLLEKLGLKYPEYAFFMTGSVALDEAFAKANQQDLMTLFPIALLIMLILSAVLMRSILCAIAALLSVSGAILGSLSFAGFAGIPLSSVSVSSPTIVMILTFAQIVHLFVAYHNAAPTDSRRERVEASVRKILLPSSLTSLTTFLGLMTLLASPIPPFQHLGAIAGFGVLFAFVLTILLGSPLLMLYKPNQKNKLLLLQPMMTWWANQINKKTVKQFLTPVLFLCIGISSFLWINELNDNYVEYFDETFEFRRDTDQIEKGLSGIYSLEYDLPAKNKDVFSIDYLEKLKTLKNKISSMPGVTTIDTMFDSISRVEAALNPSSGENLPVPLSRDDAERNSTLFEMSVPADFDFRNRVNDTLSSSRLTVYLSNISIKEINSLDIEIQKLFRADNYWHRNTQATGVSILFSSLGLKNIQAMLSGTALLFLASMILMFIIFKSFWTALVATLGNIIPATMTLGLWGIFVGELGLASAAVATVTLGIVIDDTIHLSHHFQREISKGKKAEHAMQLAISQTGSALLTSTIILMVGFLLLIFSGFELNASLGSMVATTVIIAALFDLYILPILLVKTISWRSPVTFLTFPTKTKGICPDETI